MYGLLVIKFIPGYPYFIARLTRLLLKVFRETSLELSVAQDLWDTKNV